MVGFSSSVVHSASDGRGSGSAGSDWPLLEWPPSKLQLVACSLARAHLHVGLAQFWEELQCARRECARTRPLSLNDVAQMHVSLDPKAPPSDKKNVKATIKGV